MDKLVKFIKDEDGLEMVEYAVVLALVTTGIIALVIALGDNVNNKFSTANSIIVR